MVYSCELYFGFESSTEKFDQTLEFTVKLYSYFTVGRRQGL